MSEFIKNNRLKKMNKYIIAIALFLNSITLMADCLPSEQKFARSYGLLAPSSSNYQQTELWNNGPNSIYLEDIAISAYDKVDFVILATGTKLSRRLSEAPGAGNDGGITLAPAEDSVYGVIRWQDTSASNRVLGGQITYVLLNTDTVNFHYGRMELPPNRGVAIRPDVPGAVYRASWVWCE